VGFVALSYRALRDLDDVESYSKKRWGTRVANKYLKSIESALILLKNNSSLLRTRPDLSLHFQLYRVQSHVLVCVVKDKNVFILTISHSSMDIRTRLLELEPHLLSEAAALYKKFVA
jgi:plasmid stabilization system protein ParE